MDEMADFLARFAVRRALLLAFAFAAAGLVSTSRGAATSAPAMPIPLAAPSPDSDQHDDPPDAPDRTWRHFVRWIGHFHPPLTAFPVAMLIAAAMAELLRLFRTSSWLEGASRWSVLIGAAGALICAPLGWAFAVDHAGSKILELHRWLGTATGVVALVLLLLSEVGRRNQGGWLVLFRLVLFAAVPLVIATGFFGGAMIYGLHAYSWGYS